MNRSARSALGRLLAGVAMAGICVACPAPEVEEVTVVAPRMDTLGLSHAAVTGSRLQVDVLDLLQSISAIDQQSMQVKAQSTVTDAANGTTGLTECDGQYRGAPHVERAVAESILNAAVANHTAAGDNPCKLDANSWAPAADRLPVLRSGWLRLHR